MQGLIHGELQRNNQFLCWLLKENDVHVDTEEYYVDIARGDGKFDRHHLSPGDTLTIKVL